MLPIKRLICPERVRRLPPHFSWVDHRLIRDGHIERCDADALALYLFLVTVADVQGLSYYSDKSVTKQLSMAPQRLARARANLLRAGLIAYSPPLYQVLALEPIAVDPSVHHDDVQARIEALRQMLAKPVVNQDKLS